MKNVLVLTTDLPFFPGKNGHDFFNLRFLAQHCRVGVVAPNYDSHPAEGVANLERAIQHVYLWPRAVESSAYFVDSSAEAWLPRWVLRLPSIYRLKLLKRLLGISGHPSDAYERLAILANCAPQLLKALNERPWEGVVLIQTSMAPWLNFLPTFGAKIVYFHDVRSDYLTRSGISSTEARPDLIAIQHQEEFASTSADAVGFVSNLDHQRAVKLLKLPPTVQIAPIPLDTDYFKPRPADRPAATRKIVLFTGHLLHPPNVDAVLYFLREIWPLVLTSVPEAVFQAVGLTPDRRLTEAINNTSHAEIHANVPDIRPYFWDAAVYIVPMRFGGGVRQKIFEAWLMRVPVVSTRMGMEGIAAETGRNCWIEDKTEAFASRIAEVINNGCPNALLDAAEESVKHTNSLPVAATAFCELIRNGISARRRRPYRLLYDLRWMKLGVVGGVEQMTYELIHAISQIDRTNQYRAYAPRSAFQEWDLDPTFQCLRFYHDPREKTWESLRATLTNRLAESLSLQPVMTREMRSLRAYRQMDFDLVHSPLGYIHPDLQAFPNILTIHDLQHLTYPEFFENDAWAEREKLYRQSAGRAAHIICISEFTRQEVHRHYQIPLERMTTIWNIPTGNVWRPLAEEHRIKVLSRMGVTRRFLLFPAHCWPHKNHVRLIEAFALICPHIDEDIILVLTGRPFPTDHPAHAAIKLHGLHTRVIHLGYRSPLEIRALFQSCMLVVFPSLFEGFGMPVAEAMIAGKPVACSNVTSLPEIAGDAALTFDPTNIHDIGARLLEIINDPDRRSQLIAAASRRRALFSARRIAIETLSLYQRVHEALYES